MSDVSKFLANPRGFKPMTVLHGLRGKKDIDDVIALRHRRPLKRLRTMSWRR
jgi:cytochrome c2